jgi:hypothetical protein
MAITDFEFLRSRKKAKAQDGGGEQVLNATVEREKAVAEDGAEAVANVEAELIRLILFFERKQWRLIRISSFLYVLSFIFMLLVGSLIHVPSRTLTLHQQVEIGNTHNKPVLRDSYFLKIDVSNILPSTSPEDAILVNSIARSIGIHDFYQVGLWNFCEGYNDEFVATLPLSSFETNHLSTIGALPIVPNPRISGGSTPWQSSSASKWEPSPGLFPPMSKQWPMANHSQTPLWCHHRPPITNHNHFEPHPGRLKPDVHRLHAKHHHLLPPDLPLAPRSPLAVVLLPLRDLRLHLRAAELHRVNHRVRHVRHIPKGHHEPERAEYQREPGAQDVCLHVAGHGVQYRGVGGASAFGDCEPEETPRDEEGEEREEAGAGGEEPEEVSTAVLASVLEAEEGSKTKREGGRGNY